MRFYLLLLFSVVQLLTMETQAKTWTPDEVKDVIRKANTYWQTNNSAEVRAFWDNAAYHTGNIEVYKLLRDQKMLDYSIRWAEHNQWRGARLCPLWRLANLFPDLYRPLQYRGGWKEKSGKRIYGGTCQGGDGL